MCVCTTCVWRWVCVYERAYAWNRFINKWMCTTVCIVNEFHAMNQIPEWMNEWIGWNENRFLTSNFRLKSLERAKPRDWIVKYSDRFHTYIDTTNGVQFYKHWHCERIFTFLGATAVKLTNGYDDYLQPNCQTDIEVYLRLIIFLIISFYLEKKKKSNGME